MHTQILPLVEQVWQHQLTYLEEAVQESIEGLQNLLRLDEYHRHGHEQSQLERSMGPLGNEFFNTKALSKVLEKGKGDRRMPDDRLQRIHQLISALQDNLQYCSKLPGSFPSASFSGEISNIIKSADQHLNKMADIFRNLRIAQLEQKTKYDPGRHDELFAQFNWQNLSQAELRRCPPFVVEVNPDLDLDTEKHKVLSILESARPVKITAPRSIQPKVYPQFAYTTFPPTLALEMIPLTLRNVYFLQTTITAPDFTRSLFEALSSPCPTFVSILEQEDHENEEEFRQRAESAMASRAFPAIKFDPFIAAEFVTCLDLSANPNREDKDALAHFFYSLDAFQKEFSDPDPETHQENLMKVSEFLSLPRNQRFGKSPCIYLPDADGEEHPKVLSSNLISQISEREHAWRTLKELAGIQNPYVKSTEIALTAEFDNQMKSREEELRQKFEKEQEGRDVQIKAQAVRQIVAHLTGTDPNNIDTHVEHSQERQE